MKKCRVRRGKRGITVRSVHGRDNVIAPCEYGFYEDDDSIHLLSSSSPSCRLLAGRDHYSAQRFLKAERKSIGTSWSRDFHRLLSFARFHERSISLTLIVVRLRERPLFLSLSLSLSQHGEDRLGCTHVLRTKLLGLPFFHSICRAELLSWENLLDAASITFMYDFFLLFFSQSSRYVSILRGIGEKNWKRGGEGKRERRGIDGPPRRTRIQFKLNDPIWPIFWKQSKSYQPGHAMCNLLWPGRGFVAGKRISLARRAVAQNG